MCSGRGTLTAQMNGPETLGYFFGNLSRLIGEAQLTPRNLSLQIGRSPDYIAEIIRCRRSPDLEAVYAIADALRVDVADLLRPGPFFGITAENSGNYWAEKVAEGVLATALEESRQKTAFEAPTFDAVLNWWHANNGLLADMDAFEQYVEIFNSPDLSNPRPMPNRMGAQSLAARELGITTIEQLRLIFESSEPAVARAVALAHLDVAGGQPKLSAHTIMIDLSSGQLVKLDYMRLLLPVRDGDGQNYVLNYSKPIRRNEIGREHIGEFEPVHRRQPVLSGLD